MANYQDFSLIKNEINVVKKREKENGVSSGFQLSLLGGKGRNLKLI